MLRNIYLLILFSTYLYSNIINIKKGENIFIENNSTINIPATFKNYSGIQVIVNDPISKKEATFPFKKNKLRLNSIETGVKYKITSNKDQTINIIYRTINNQCKNLLNSNKFNYLENSGLERQKITNNLDHISLSSRYYSNELKNRYDATNVILIYPKIKNTSKIRFSYGPAKPKINIKYAKEYEGEKFYVYDFFYEKCFQGYFPSPKILPYTELRELK